MQRTVSDLLEAARATVPEVTVEELAQLLDAGGVDVVLDVRDVSELAAGTIPGAVHVSRGLLEFKAEAGSPIADERLAGRTAARIAVACASGGRSLLAARRLQKMGYENVCSVAGGFKAWTAAGYTTQEDR